MAREMLVNVAESEECRVAVIENGVLEELYVERASSASHVGNVYKGKVVNIEVGIQAAFIDLGTGRNGFLHISDLHPRYFPGKQNDLVETVGRRQSLKDRPPIQDCLRKGKEIVVQVTKEGLKTKGPTLSTYLALPGKYIVMMPWMKKHGISQKIEDEDERKRLKQILDESKPPKGVGCIVRTAGETCAKRDIQSDLRYLTRLWTAIEKRMDTLKAPGELYQESDLVIRALRDIFNNKITNIVCDSESMVRKINDFLTHAYPRMKQKVTLYDQGIPLFHKYGIEDEIDKIQARSVDLRTGGSIVIEQTEALVAIDVNSGRHHSGKGAEQTALETNLEAATEIARQLRLRDLGGLIICDFIDMRQQKSRKEVERVFRTAVKADRARSKLLAISRFGVVEMTRQRMRSSLQFSTYLTCPHCAGMGFVKSHESLAIEIIRLLHLAVAKSQIMRIELSVSPEVANYLQNAKRGAIAEMEQASEKRIIVRAMPDFPAGKRELACFNQRGSLVRLDDIMREDKPESEKNSHRSRQRDRNRSRNNGIADVGREAKAEQVSPEAPAAVAVEETPQEKEDTQSRSSDAKPASKTGQKSRRRSRGRNAKKTGTTPEQVPEKTTEQTPAEEPPTLTETVEVEASEEKPAKKKRSSRRSRRKPSKAATEKTAETATAESDNAAPADKAPEKPVEEPPAAPVTDHSEKSAPEEAGDTPSSTDTEGEGDSDKKTTKKKSKSGSSRKRSRPRRRKKRSSTSDESKSSD